MGMTQVDAWDSSRILDPRNPRITGYSSRTTINWAGLRLSSNNFFQKLRRIRQVEAWPVFACAEVNAVHLLTQGNSKLSNIRIQKAVDGHLLKPPCSNCDQWLELTENRIYKIRDSFLMTDQEEADSRTPKPGPTKADFPPLS